MGVISNTGGGGGGNVRYDPTTDMVQIKYNGVWTDWKSGNMKRHYLLLDGEQETAWTVSNVTYTTGRTMSAATITASGIKHPYPASINYQTYNSATANKVSVDDYSKMCIEYIANGTTYTKEFNISAINGSYYVCFATWNMGSTTGVFDMVLSTSLETNYNNRVWCASNDAGGYIWQTTYPSAGILISKVWLE